MQMRTTGLETTLKMTYDFINIPPHDANEHESGNQIPYYLNGDFTPLNKFYQPIDGDVYALNASQDIRDPFTQNIFPSTFKPQDNILISFPNPQNYQTKEEFMMAFELWYTEATIYLSYMNLPNPISGEFYLPELPKIFTKEEKSHPGRFRTFKPELWPLLPNNYFVMLQKIYQKDEIDPNEQFPDQVPKRDPLCYKHHVTSKDQWCSTLVASEPNPIIYDFFEEYEEAYVKWSNITYDTLKSYPIPPKDMQTVATLDLIPFEAPCETVPPQPEHDTKLFEWAHQTPSPSNYGTLVQQLHNLKTKPKERSKHKLHYDKVLYVFGVSKKQFITENVEYGFYEPAIKSPTIINPTIFVKGYPEKKIEKVQNVLKTPQINVNHIDFILYILNYNYNSKQFAEVLNLEFNGKPLITYFEPLMSSYENVIKIFFKSKRSILDKLRIGNFLSSYITTTETLDFINIIFSPENLIMFHEFIELVNYNSKYRVEMLPIVTDKTNEKFLLINRFYLLDLFLSLFRDFNGSKFYTLAFSQCHIASSKVSQIVYEENFLKQLRSSKKGTDYYCCLLMLLHSNSTRIHRILLGADFLTWVSINIFLTMETCRIVIVTRAEFAEAIAKHLEDSDFLILHETWLILNFLVEKPDALFEILKNNTLCKTLSNLIKKDDNALRRRFFEFTANVFTKNDPNLHNIIIENVLMDSIGRIVTLFKSQKLFLNNALLKEKLEFCLNWLLTQKTPQTLKFEKAFLKHAEMKLENIMEKLNPNEYQKKEKDEKDEK
ncbi:hypothetical protein GPJ56_002003 [Histomonas meleagridis]|uniref:uncharacterized protein n=1 Tax=Histomonas meleagridis TaxID=135588 RepID=UPI00355A1DB9|nr:hypothetical protein GPJ56_002003 [Histomonas meleagridis]KAH0800920.1 hypothetical protein GO595_006236 [Histomonas meleagridis]